MYLEACLSNRRFISCRVAPFRENSVCVRRKQQLLIGVERRALDAIKSSPQMLAGSGRVARTVEQPCNECKEWQGSPSPVSWRRLRTGSGHGQQPEPGVVSHSCDRGWHTPLLLKRDRTTGMSGEGNRGDVIGRILSTHKTRRSRIPRHWRTPLSLSTFSQFDQHLRPLLHARYSPSSLSHVPWRVRLTKPLIDISPRHSLRQCLRVLLARVLPRPSLLPPPRISPETLTVYTQAILTHSL